MNRLLKSKIYLGFLVNPFYIYCISFVLAIFIYLWGWSDLYPKLSAKLLIFFLLSFIAFSVAGYKLNPGKFIDLKTEMPLFYFNDIMFLIIIFLGLLNILLMGYLPVIDTSHNYLEYGIHVIDPLFNTLSIFFSVFYFQSYLTRKNKRFIFYVVIILILQILIFRRSTIVWIVLSSVYLFILYKQKIRIIVLLLGILCIPVLSYCFGLYGNARSNLSKSYVINDLGASDVFKSSGISHNNYMTYLYVSSPLANLQKNIDERADPSELAHFRSFIFYCLVPQSVTLRLERSGKLHPPSCYLITPDLIVGTFFMIGFYTFGWTGMFVMLAFLIAFILISLKIIRKIEIFGLTTFSILSSAVSFLIFSNFLNRMDIILMIICYPVFFHFIYKTNWANVLLLCRKKLK